MSLAIVSLDEPAATRTSAGWWHYAVLGLILAGALVMRLYRLDKFSLWGDTGVTFTACIGKNIPSLIRVGRMVVPDNPPLDLLVRHLAMKCFGQNTYVFVLPSVLFSVLGTILSGIACR